MFCHSNAKNRRYPIGMTWHDLAFIHWPFPAEKIRPLIPAGLELDTFEGQAWIGIVPFYMSGVGYPFLRELPVFSQFLELNVRTYVKREGYSGVWFFSLDAASRFAVRYCRTLYRLPYYFSKMKLDCRTPDLYCYENIRVGPSQGPVRFSNLSSRRSCKAAPGWITG
jgi:uncharacterized protein YqjF (DUF2071 family)